MGWNVLLLVLKSDKEKTDLLVFSYLGGTRTPNIPNLQMNYPIGRKISINTRYINDIGYALYMKGGKK